MKKTIVFAAFLSIFMAAPALKSLEVDIDEIKKAKKVEFQNYRGRPKRIDPVRDIFMIGQKLAEGSKNTYNAPFRYLLKYSIIRAVSTDEPQKLSADIFSIDRDAQVDHIDNVRRIAAGYLGDMYGYTQKQAWALSVFISYYNAVYRGDTGYFSGVYKSIVMKNITPKNAGISTRYYDWPGATKMLIPLTEAAKRGDIDSIDPFIISDEKTKKELRRDDTLIPERKEVADMKEKKIEKEKEKITEKKTAIEKKKEEIEKEKKTVEEKKTAIEKEKEKIARREEEVKKEKETIKTIAEPEKKKEKEKEVEKKEKEIAAEKEKGKKDEKETGEKIKKIDEKKEEVKKDEKKIAEKEKEIKKKEEAVKEEKKEIKEDEKKKEAAKETKTPETLKKKEDELKKKEKELDKREDAIRSKEPDKNIYALKLYYLKIREYLEGGHYNNELFMIDATNRKILFKSPVTNICGSRYDVFSDGIAVITHTGDHKSGHRLMLIDRENLQTKTTGTDDVFWRSFVEIKDGFIYAITVREGKYYLGRFDGKLQLTARSGESINENTFISFFGDYIYINKFDKSIMVLNKNDLSLIDVIKP